MRHQSLQMLEVFFLKLGVTPCKIEQPLRSMELQAQKD